MRSRLLPAIAGLSYFLVSPCGADALSAQVTQNALRIVVIEGEDAVNIVQQKSAVAPVVEVRDRNDQPVAGVVVQFAIRSGRATFNGARALSVTTHAAGRAVATGLTPTGNGALQIGAAAAFQGQTAAVTIAQTNVMTAAQAAAATGAAVAEREAARPAVQALELVGPAAVEASRRARLRASPAAPAQPRSPQQRS